MAAEPKPIMAISEWPTNGHLIADCARLGYLQADKPTLDPTYGLGIFWSVWRPAELTASDLDPAKSPSGVGVDARHLPYADRSFFQVVIDGPYKLNGTPSAGIDERYGVHESTHWRDRQELLGDMLAEGYGSWGMGVCCSSVRTRCAPGGSGGRRTSLPPWPRSWAWAWSIGWTS